MFHERFPAARDRNKKIASGDTTRQIAMSSILNQVQVNIPFTMLVDTYLERFLTERINPEIGVVADALDRFTPLDVKRVADQLHAQNLRITLHGPFQDLSPGSPDPAVRRVTRERLQQFLRWIPYFKPVTVVCHAGYDHRRYGYAAAQWRQRAIQTWSWFGLQVQEAGAQLVLENVYETGPEEMRDLLQALHSVGVGFCFDTGHQAAFSRASIARWLDVLGPFVREIHLHDNTGQDDHLGLGQGRIDFRPLFDFLKARQASRPIITLEPHQASQLEVSTAYLEQHWPW